MTDEYPERDGETFDMARDGARLNAQHHRVMGVMRDHQWHTLSGISVITGDPEASISARLRDFRKRRFGGYIVHRRYVEAGLHEYRLSEAIPTLIIKTRMCVVCGKKGEVEMDMMAWHRWQGGLLLQEAAPEMSAGLREQLITGIHSDCWDAQFGEDDE